MLARRGDKPGAAAELTRYLDSGPADSLELAETTRDLAARGVDVPHADGN